MGGSEAQVRERVYRILGVVAGYAVLAGCAGAWYAWSLIHSDRTTVGYEKDWSFQLLMFALFKLPYTLPILATALILAWRGASRGSEAAVHGG